MSSRLLGYVLTAALSQSAASAQDAAPATEAAATLALKKTPPIKVKSGPQPQLLTSFSSPAPELRPRVRYWVPQAAVTEAGIRRDVQRLASHGFGGVELVSMDMPKGIPASYAWGTPPTRCIRNTSRVVGSRSARTSSARRSRSRASRALCGSGPAISCSSKL